MKTAFVSLLALGSASAFAPSQTASKATQLAATAELDGLIGTDIETGKKIVSCCATGRVYHIMFMVSMVCQMRKTFAEN